MLGGAVVRARALCDAIPTSWASPEAGSLPNPCKLPRCWRSSPTKHKLKLHPGQPPRSEDKRVSKRAAKDDTDDDYIETRGPKRPKVNEGSALEAPSRRRSIPSTRDSGASITKSADRLAIAPAEWKAEYEKQLYELNQTREITRETGLNQAGNPLEPLCTAYRIYIANWTSSDPTIRALAGYLNLYCCAQVGVLWTMCRDPLRTLHNSHEKHYKVTGGVFEKAGLSAFLQLLEGGAFKLKDITSIAEPTIARGKDGTMSEPSQFLMLARFIYQIFSIVAKHRQQDPDFPNVFSGAGEGLKAEVLFRGSLNWITEDMYRVLALWGCFASRLRKQSKSIDEEKYTTLNVKGKPLVLPIFMRRAKHVDVAMSTSASKHEASVDTSSAVGPATNTAAVRPLATIENVERVKSTLPSEMSSFTQADMRMRHLQGLTAVAERARAAVDTFTLNGERSSAAITTLLGSQPRLVVPELRTSFSPAIEPSSSIVQHRPSTAGLFRQIKESNSVTPRSKRDESPVEKHFSSTTDVESTSTKNNERSTTPNPSESGIKTQVDMLTRHPQDQAPRALRASTPQLSRGAQGSSPPIFGMPSALAQRPELSASFMKLDFTAKAHDKLSGSPEAQPLSVPQAVSEESIGTGKVLVPPATVQPDMIVPESKVPDMLSSSIMQESSSAAGLLCRLMERQSIGEQRKAEAKRKYEEIKKQEVEELEIEAEKDRTFQQESGLKYEVDEQVVAAIDAKSAQALGEILRIKERYAVKDELTKKLKWQRESDVEALRSGNVCDELMLDQGAIERKEGL
ncbi:hypothetical protein LTS10_010511 [Elasticomyces elasticus]|nr:hypothetical protein LTS10_010511 [Elasticomyces elasticus]